MYIKTYRKTCKTKWCMASKTVMQKEAEAYFCCIFIAPWGAAEVVPRHSQDLPKIVQDKVMHSLKNGHVRTRPNKNAQDDVIRSIKYGDAQRSGGIFCRIFITPRGAAEVVPRHSRDLLKNAQQVSKWSKVWSCGRHKLLNKTRIIVLDDAWNQKATMVQKMKKTYLWG